MFTLNFHYEDVSRQDPLLKPNHANVMEVTGSCKIRVVPKAAPSDFIIKNGKLAMEIPCGQNLIQTQRASTGKSFRSNPFLGSNKEKKGYVSDLARQSTLRGHGMSHFLIAFAFASGLVLSIAVDTEYVLINDLTRAVMQFYPPLSGEGFVPPLTPPPGNSGFELLPAAAPLQEPEAQQAQNQLVSLLEKQLRRYCADQKVAQKFPALQYQEMNTFAKHLALEELEIEGKPATEVAGLTTYLKKFRIVKSFFHDFFNAFFEE